MTEHKSAASTIREIQEAPEGKCRLVILCPGLGDDNIEYDPKDRRSLEAAKKKFEGATQGKRRMAGIAIQKDGSTTHAREFDSEAKGHVVVPPISGG